MQAAEEVYTYLRDNEKEGVVIVTGMSGTGKSQMVVSAIWKLFEASR